MNFKFNRNEKSFLGDMIIATGIAWPVGFVVTIALSYGVVNLFYPEETNLIAGICIGAVVAFSQRLILKKYFAISTWWIFAAVIGIGLPFVIDFIFFELKGNESSITGIEILDMAAIMFAGGLITGLLQHNSLKSHTSKFRWWIIVSAMAWGLGWCGLMLGGVVFGLISGIALLNLLKLPVNAEMN